MNFPAKSTDAVTNSPTDGSAATRHNLANRSGLATSLTERPPSAANHNKQQQPPIHRLKRGRNFRRTKRQRAGVDRKTIRKLARRAKVVSMEGTIYGEARAGLRGYLQEVIARSIVLTTHRHSHHVEALDVLHGITAVPSRYFTSNHSDEDDQDESPLTPCAAAAPDVTSDLTPRDPALPSEKVPPETEAAAQRASQLSSILQKKKQLIEIMCSAARAN